CGCSVGATVATVAGHNRCAVSAGTTRTAVTTATAATTVGADSARVTAASAASAASGKSRNDEQQKRAESHDYQPQALPHRRPPVSHRRRSLKLPNSPPQRPEGRYCPDWTKRYQVRPSRTRHFDNLMASYGEPFAPPPDVP